MAMVTLTRSPASCTDFTAPTRRPLKFSLIWGKYDPIRLTLLVDSWERRVRRPSRRLLWSLSSLVVAAKLLRAWALAWADGASWAETWFTLLMSAVRVAECWA